MAGLCMVSIGSNQALWLASIFPAQAQELAPATSVHRQNPPCAGGFSTQRSGHLAIQDWHSGSLNRVCVQFHWHPSLPVQTQCNARTGVEACMKAILVTPAERNSRYPSGGLHVAEPMTDRLSPASLVGYCGARWSTFNESRPESGTMGFHAAPDAATASPRRRRTRLPSSFRVPLRLPGASGFPRQRRLPCICSQPRDCCI